MVQNDSEQVSFIQHHSGEDVAYKERVLTPLPEADLEDLEVR